MDSYFALPSIQLPFQRRLSRLYNDTKKSSDFVKEPVQNAEDPEIKALHRKLRIQKDRLVSWGLEWSDPSQSSEVLIDSSLSRAGLSEVVGSIMSTIKDTLAEVEPLWLSSKRLVGGSDAGDGAGGDGTVLDKGADHDRDRKLLIVTWDKARFADLVRDLTVSIDTLYDLSRTRSSVATAGPASIMPGSSKLAMATSSAPLPTKHDLSAVHQRFEQQQHSPHPQHQSPKHHLPYGHHQLGQSPSSTMQLTSDDAKLFESSRLLVPQQIDSAMLTTIESSTHPPEMEPKTREVVFMSKQAYAELGARPLSGSYPPLLLEYAYFDPVFSSTGIMPSMVRFEKLASGLRGDSRRLSGAYSGCPRLLGYFDDMDHSRVGLVYQFPVGFHAIAAPEGATQSPATLRACLYTLGDLLGSPGFEPKLEAKFRLASNLANAVFEMHAKGIAHGNLIDTSILFGRVQPPVIGLPSPDVAQVDIRHPVISSFDLFPDTPGPASSESRRRRSSRLHQHPLNPISFAPGAPPIVDADPCVYDLYSLAMLLLSIGMWTRLENLVPHQDSTMVSEAVLDQLSTQCGTLYMKAVQACWTAMELVVSAGKAAAESHMARLQVRVSSYLETCCVLDDVNKLEARLRNDLGGDEISAPTPSTVAPAPPPRATPVRTQTAPAPLPPPKMASPPPAAPLALTPQMRTRSLLAQSLREHPLADIVDTKPPPVPPKTGHIPTVPSTPIHSSAPVPAATTAASLAPVADAAKERVRMRLYPQVPLPPDVVEKWHTYLMPQVNYALRHFYRSHPESVEISLESVGDSPRTTRPTVVVVCTSVAKVRAILKRKLGKVFEGTNGIGLKVCTGRVMRSRKSGAVSGAAAARPSYLGVDYAKDVAAANSQFQQKPQNGASIGAWIGDRHLPPVSFGGLVLVDDKPYGMTVHHMLDDPDATEAAAARESQKALRSSGAAAAALATGEEEEQIEQLGRSVLDWYADLQASSGADAEHLHAADEDAYNEEYDEDDEDDEDEDDDKDYYACEFSDTSSAVSESDITSEWSDSDNDDHAASQFGDDKADGSHIPRHGEEDEEDEDDAERGHEEPGDVPGVEPGYGEGYVVTQPALDDVDGNFYPDEDTQDDDHLDSCGLGDVYASSGVRRRIDEHGLVHEIDWALFEFKEERLPRSNSIPHLPLPLSFSRHDSQEASASADAEDAANPTDPSETCASGSGGGILHPTTVAPASALPGLEVQCMARTSGLQTGRILPTITSVKIYGRTSPSHTYQISAATAASAAASAEEVAASTGGSATSAKKSAVRPIGIPGDSGAWIVDREHGRLCGHVLAWSARKRVAYLCPMDVLLLDIAETLEAGEVRLPGGEAVVKIMDAEDQSQQSQQAEQSQQTHPKRTKETGSVRKRRTSAGLLTTSLSTSSLTLHESWTADGGSGIAEAGKGVEGVDNAEGADSADGEDSSSGAKKGGRWQESTKIFELVGRMGKVHMGSGKDVRMPC